MNGKIAKQKNKTTTMIEATTRATTGMGNSIMASSSNTSSQNFEGEQPIIGVVLGLHFEKNYKKVPLKIFIDNMDKYISKTTMYGNEVVGIVDRYKDVRSTYFTNHMPKSLIIEDKKSDIKIHIQNQRINVYVTKEMGMVNNINSIHANIWGQCKDILQNMIQNLCKLTMKHKEEYVIWLLNNLKIVSIGI